MKLGFKASPKMNSVVLMNECAAGRHLPLQHPHHNRAQQEAHALAHQPRPHVNGNLRPPHRRLPCTVVSPRGPRDFLMIVWLTLPSNAYNQPKGLS